MYKHTDKEGGKNNNFCLVLIIPARIIMVRSLFPFVWRSCSIIPVIESKCSSSSRRWTTGYRFLSKMRLITGGAVHCRYISMIWFRFLNINLDIVFFLCSMEFFTILVNVVESRKGVSPPVLTPARPVRRGTVLETLASHGSSCSITNVQITFYGWSNFL